MAAEEGVECRHCGRVVVPRLWPVGGGFLRYVRMQHLCPYCGVVMYETGGTYKREAVIATAMIACAVLAAALIVALVRLYR